MNKRKREVVAILPEPELRDAVVAYIRANRPDIVVRSEKVPLYVRFAVDVASRTFSAEVYTEES